MKRSRYQQTTTISLAGWLIADLFLGISMLFLISNAAIPLIQITPTQPESMLFDTTPTPALTLTPTHTPTSLPLLTSKVGLDLEPVKVFIQISDINGFLDHDRGRQGFKSQFDARFPAEYRDRRAGLILAYGYHTSAQIATGRRLATEATKILQKDYPDIFGDAVTKSFWWDVEYHPIGYIELEIYFFTQVDP